MLPRSVSVLRTFDVLLRFAFFAIAPFVLVMLAAMFPILGIVINMALALIVFAFAATMRRYGDRWPLLGKVLGKQLSFETFYRAHRPKPFVFYVFYPLMLPYVAFNRVARKELGLYRGVSGVGLVLLSGGALWDFFRKWQPELGFGAFAANWIALLFFQAVFTIALVMPMTTTVIELQMQSRRGALFALLAAALLSMGLAIGVVANKRHTVVQWPTVVRMGLRTRADADRSRRLHEKALARALLSIRRGDAETLKSPRGTEIMGGPVVDARDTLLSLYKEDETECFHLVAFKTKRGPVLVLFALTTKKNKVIWLGMSGNGDTVEDEDDLPDNAIATMWKIGKR